MTKYDAVVIGAGNGGLTAAALMAQKGLNVMLLERHNVPGGAATTFCRGRFEFEVALHQLSGLGTPEKPGPLRMLLDKLGVTQELEFVEMNELYTVHMPDGFKVTLPPDLKLTAEVLAEKFPKEKDNIHAFFQMVEQYAADMLGAFIFRDPDPSREKYPQLYKYALRNVKDVLDEFFTDARLKAVLSGYWGYLGVSPKRLAFAYVAIIFFSYAEFKPFHIKGGSQALSNTFYKKFIQAGGAARFNCSAERILVKDNQVQGVVTSDGDTLQTNNVVSNASQVLTYLKMIEPGLVPSETLTEMNGRNIATSAFTLYAGFDCEPRELGITQPTNFLIKSTDIEDGPTKGMHSLGFDDELFVMSCYDVAVPDFSPPGTCQANIVTLKFGDQWLRVPPHQYHRTKFECAEAVLQRVEEIFPKVRTHIEEIEVATPLTHMRYLGTPLGSVYGFEHQTKDSLFFQPDRRSSINGLFFAGGWVGDAGFQPTIEAGAAAGKMVVRNLSAA
jgi:phytoene dehydrogenase-like protein